MSSNTVLYHYCSATAMKDIVESESIWLTNMSCMSDYREHNWLIHIACEHLHSLKQSRTNTLGECLLHLFEYVRPQDPFAACFSEDGDCLSQWRAYADDGTGVAIGFDPTCLGIHQSPPIAASKDLTGLCKVNYNAVEQETLVRDTLKKCLAELPADPQPREIESVAAACMRELYQWAPSFKNPGFREEKEWRIIHLPFFPHRLDEIDPTHEQAPSFSTQEFMVRRGRLIPYIALRFRRHKPIKRVIWGPKCQMEECAATSLFLMHGYQMINPAPNFIDNFAPDVEFARSATPYR